MRIISGTAGGRKLVSPEGEQTRPTAGYVKESIFNIVQFDIEGRRVLDLFAGSGQLGVEALSRGAERAVFVDNRRECIKIIKENLKTTGFSDKARVAEEDFAVFLSKERKGEYGLVFMDPPYGSGMIKKALSLATSFDILAIGGIIICELDKDDDTGKVDEPYAVRREYIYGRKKLVLIVRQDEGA